jgi:glycerate kinase
MRILIASDSFKDALPAPEVCRALARGVRAALPKAEVTEFPLADGGEGTFEVLAAHLGLQAVEAATVDPLGRPIRAVYGRSADGRKAFVELAKASGLQLLRPEERNPLKTSTYGTGLLIADALRAGCHELVLAIGSSATNDAGMGMAAALGWQFLDEAGKPLAPAGENLVRVARMIPPASRPALTVQVICDVTNPLYGQMGAARVYARQKGANETAIEQLDLGLHHFAEIVGHQLGGPDRSGFPGAGAAGGMGFGALTFLGAELRRGIDLVLDLTGFNARLAECTLLVTGEGRIDHQTAHGKLVHGLCERASHLGIPVIAFCGALELDEAQQKEIGLYRAFSINGPEPLPLAEALARTSEQLEITAREVFLSGF